MNYKQSRRRYFERDRRRDLDAMAHCATRLRLVLNDESLVNEEALNNMDVVKGTFSTGDNTKLLLGLVQSIKYLVNWKN